MVTAEPPRCTAQASKPKKTLTRRAQKDHTQQIRRSVQVLFLLLNVWIGTEFYQFVRYYETGGTSPWMARPSGIEGWLPIASLMNLKALFETSSIPPSHAAGMFLLTSFLVISWLLRKSFCGWLCPVGTVSEWLWRFGNRTFGRTWALPRWLDIPLRSLKYILLGLFLYAVGSMAAPQIRQFLESPYGYVADVKMLNFFRFMSVTTAVTLGVLLIASIFIKNFWCRYLCPYGALTGLAALASPLRIRREPDLCIDCAKCAKACPSQLKVDQLITIRTAECLGCMECVTVCPAQGALYMSAGKKRPVPAWALAAAMALIFFGFVGYARWAGYWETNVPSQVYFDLIPRAHEFGHP
jgi:polyferredoxin